MLYELQLWPLLSGDTGENFTPGDLTLIEAAGPAVNLYWSDSVTDEGGYAIERRDVTAASAFAAINTVGPGITTYHDDGPFTDNHIYEYRLRVVSGAHDGEYSNSVRAFNRLDIAVFGHPRLFIGIGLGI